MRLLGQQTIEKMRVFAPILFIALIMGCATTQSIPIEYRSRTYDVAYDVAFDAVVLALAEQGYAIEEANKDQGIISTDFLLEESFLGFLAGPSRVKVNGLVRDSQAGVRVMLTIAVQDSDLDGPGGNYSTRNLTTRQARDYYDNLFMHIEDVM